MATCNRSRRHVFRWSAKKRVWKRTAKGRRRRWKGKNREINEGDKQKGGRKEAQNPFIVYYTQSRWSPASFRELKCACTHTHTHTHTLISKVTANKLMFVVSLELLSLYHPPPPFFLLIQYLHASCSHHFILFSLFSAHSVYLDLVRTRQDSHTSEMKQLSCEGWQQTDEIF